MAHQRDIIPTYRVLTEPIYDIDFWILRLTWQEAVICALSWILGWLIFEMIGLGKISFFGIHLDPTIAGFVVGLLFAVLISVLHWINPNGSVELVLHGLKEPTSYIGRTKDRFWKPSLMPHFKKIK
ncbi:MAG TPA: hypothetical protein PKY82_34610 [Pyrinomonadaceae bacterium]|nr:hypothetical protein [Pyrinomonadaceae bacterium]